MNRTHGILTFIRGMIHRRSFYGERYEISSIEAGIVCANKRGEEDIAYDRNTDDNHV